jgi:UDP-N-acetylglucosamine--N-acetylmuramyl-(pentapeptide) pyrophosphoryl-undecaprenol N-acetylglucosamine transferase
MTKLVLTGGGTAGHVVPHLALLPHLRNQFDKIFYIGSHDGIEKKIIAEQARGIEYFSVATAKLRRSFDVRNLGIPFKLLKGIADAKRILKNLKPDIVFSKGGFVAYPVVRAAAKLGIPVVAHESDMTMGLANKMSAKYCKTICTTFRNTACQSKEIDIIHTGSPIREEIYNGIPIKIERRHGFKSGGRNLLVVGGSLGAQKINEAVRGALVNLKFNVVHIVGKGKVIKDWIASPSARNDRGYVQLEYVNDIQNYFAWADVVVSRAGSNAMCELLVLKKPTLFIPLATGRGDQIENAKEVLKNKAAAVLWEADLTADTLVKHVDEVYKNREMYSKNTANMGEMDGTKKIAEVIVRSLSLRGTKQSRS